MINSKEVKKIASLARIGIDEKDLGKFSHDLSAVLEWFEQLKEVDVTDVVPTAHITGMDDIVREDKVAEFSETKKIIALFPEKKESYDKVKSIL